MKQSSRMFCNSVQVDDSSGDMDGSQFYRYPEVPTCWIRYPHWSSMTTSVWTSVSMTYWGKFCCTLWRGCSAQKHAWMVLVTWVFKETLALIQTPRSWTALTSNGEGRPRERTQLRSGDDAHNRISPGRIQLQMIAFIQASTKLYYLVTEAHKCE